MNFNLDQQARRITRVRNLLLTALVLGCAFSTVNQALLPRRPVESFTVRSTRTRGVHAESDSVWSSLLARP